ncbi:hypothetical protein JTY60_02245 [symbiont of Argiope bruennichi]|uniref:hypothetical protein n=1 Tax=symbiont of Argiope bruennichi TaxID=2810479 RepID=UPI003DA275BB
MLYTFHDIDTNDFSSFITKKQLLFFNVSSVEETFNELVRYFIELQNYQPEKILELSNLEKKDYKTLLELLKKNVEELNKQYNFKYFFSTESIYHKFIEIYNKYKNYQNSEFNDDIKKKIFDTYKTFLYYSIFYVPIHIMGLPIFNENGEIFYNLNDIKDIYDEKTFFEFKKKIFKKVIKKDFLYNNIDEKIHIITEIYHNFKATNSKLKENNFSKNVQTLMKEFYNVSYSENFFNFLDKVYEWKINNRDKLQEETKKNFLKQLLSTLDANDLFNLFFQDYLSLLKNFTNFSLDFYFKDKFTTDILNHQIFLENNIFIDEIKKQYLEFSNIFENLSETFFLNFFKTSKIDAIFSKEDDDNLIKEKKIFFETYKKKFVTKIKSSLLNYFEAKKNTSLLGEKNKEEIQKLIEDIKYENNNLIWLLPKIQNILNLFINLNPSQPKINENISVSNNKIDELNKFIFLQDQALLIQNQALSLDQKFDKFIKKVQNLKINSRNYYLTKYFFDEENKVAVRDFFVFLSRLDFDTFSNILNSSNSKLIIDKNMIKTLNHDKLIILDPLDEFERTATEFITYIDQKDDDSFYDHLIMNIFSKADRLFDIYNKRLTAVYYPNFSDDFKNFRDDIEKERQKTATGSRSLRLENLISKINNISLKMFDILKTVYKNDLINNKNEITGNIANNLFIDDEIFSWSGISNKKYVEYLFDKSLDNLDKLKYDLAIGTDNFSILENFSYTLANKSFIDYIYGIDQNTKELALNSLNKDIIKLAPKNLNYKQENTKDFYNWDNNTDKSLNDLISEFGIFKNSIYAVSDSKTNWQNTFKQFIKQTKGIFEENQKKLSKKHCEWIIKKINDNSAFYEYKEGNTEKLFRYLNNKNTLQQLNNFKINEQPYHNKYLFKDNLIDFLSFLLSSGKGTNFYILDTYYKNSIKLQDEFLKVNKDFLNHFLLYEIKFYGYRNFYHLQKSLSLSQIFIQGSDKYDFDKIENTINFASKKAVLDEFLTDDFINNFNLWQEKFLNKHILFCKQYYSYSNTSYIGSSFNSEIIQKLKILNENRFGTFLDNFLTDEKILEKLNSYHSKKDHRSYQLISQFDINGSEWKKFIEEQNKLFNRAIEILRKKIEEIEKNYKTIFYYREDGQFIENPLPDLNKLQNKEKNSGYLIEYFFHKLNNFRSEQDKIIKYITHYNIINVPIAYTNSIIDIYKGPQSSNNTIDFVPNINKPSHEKVVIKKNPNAYIESFLSTYAIKFYLANKNNNQQAFLQIPYVSRTFKVKKVNYYDNNNRIVFEAENNYSVVFYFFDFQGTSLVVNKDKNITIDKNYLKMPETKVLEVNIFHDNKTSDNFLIKNIGFANNVKNDRIEVKSFGVIDKKGDISNYSVSDFFSTKNNIFLSSINRLSTYLKEKDKGKIINSKKSQIFIYEWDSFFNNSIFNINRIDNDKILEFLLRHNIDIIEFNTPDKKKIPLYAIVIFTIAITSPIFIFSFYKLNKKIRAKLLVNKINLKDKNQDK